jgi:hypothetical protein
MHRPTGIFWANLTPLARQSCEALASFVEHYVSAQPEAVRPQAEEALKQAIKEIVSAACSETWAKWGRQANVIERQCDALLANPSSMRSLLDSEMQVEEPLSESLAGCMAGCMGD